MMPGFYTHLKEDRGCGVNTSCLPNGYRPLQGKKIYNLQHYQLSISMIIESGNPIQEGKSNEHWI